MKKLNLNIEALRVESFQVEAKPSARGTVLGHQSLSGLGCQDTCTSMGGDQCAATLLYTCTCRSEGGDACMMATDYATCQNCETVNCM